MPVVYIRRDGTGAPCMHNDVAAGDIGRDIRISLRAGPCETMYVVERASAG